MKIVKNEIRPIGYITLELSEAELQTIMGAIEENCYILKRPLDQIGGLRQELYEKFTEILRPKLAPSK